MESQPLFPRTRVERWKRVTRTFIDANVEQYCNFSFFLIPVLLPLLFVWLPRVSFHPRQAIVTASVSLSPVARVQPLSIDTTQEDNTQQLRYRSLVRQREGVWLGIVLCVWRVFDGRVQCSAAVGTDSVPSGPLTSTTGHKLVATQHNHTHSRQHYRRLDLSYSSTRF